MSKKSPYKEGDIVRWISGEVARIHEMNYPSDGMIALQFVEEDEIRFMDHINVDVGGIVSDSESAKLQFALTRSIHERLNKLSKV
jgi:aconitase A